MMARGRSYYKLTPWINQLMPGELQRSSSCPQDWRLQPVPSKGDTLNSVPRYFAAHPFRSFRNSALPLSRGASTFEKCPEYTNAKYLTFFTTSSTTHLI